MSSKFEFQFHCGNQFILNMRGKKAFMKNLLPDLIVPFQSNGSQYKFWTVTKVHSFILKNIFSRIYLILYQLYTLLQHDYIYSSCFSSFSCSNDWSDKISSIITSKQFLPKIKMIIIQSYFLVYIIYSLYELYHDYTGQQKNVKA